MQRRAGLVLLGASLLAGCGFALRQPTEVPYERIALAGFKPRSPMAEALRRELPARVRIVEAAAQAQVQVVADEDVLHRTVVASTAVGQVREFRLRVRLRFHFARPDGEALSGVTELEQMRDLSYSETAALGKEVEEAELLREMRADIARQVVRRLAALGQTGR
ncbi:hypothetical protein KAK07_07915 [Ideonella sp. 4Y16]|uniref:LPS-assembly lipoprotein LptE n=1 Tax=Ideonella alba TaxID=2824118 RepID=A0A940YBU8_9BURK|nr:LPS assembly lipoprotein LptE [Ideonella alba]MBQ0930191.1 hypothetical protein [Ideonella alba]MBQ0943260.1 hypothetical protein [Ideonella alba]